MYEDETLDDTASRVLKELTGLTGQYKQQFKAFGNPDRLTGKKDMLWIKNEQFNQRTITIAYYFLLKTDDVDIQNNQHQAKWYSVSQLPQLGFDHEQIIMEALDDLKVKCLSEPIIFELLPNKFTINEVQDVYQSILSIELDNRNFRKKMINKKYIIALDEKKTGVSKKPSQLYMFSKDIYLKLHRKTYLINL